VIAVTISGVITKRSLIRPLFDDCVSKSALLSRQNRRRGLKTNKVIIKQAFTYKNERCFIADVLANKPESRVPECER